MLQEEAEANKTDNASSPEQARGILNSLPQAQEYEGEVIKLI